MGYLSGSHIIGQCVLDRMAGDDLGSLKLSITRADEIIEISMDLAQEIRLINHPNWNFDMNTSTFNLLGFKYQIVETNCSGRTLLCRKRADGELNAWFKFTMNDLKGITK